MSHLRSFHGTGLIPRASGAAVAALKARAAMWDAPLVEDEAGLSMLIWGSELRLTRQADALRIDLLAPEGRLVGILRDSATVRPRPGSRLHGTTWMRARWRRAWRGSAWRGCRGRCRGSCGCA